MKVSPLYKFFLLAFVAIFAICIALMVSNRMIRNPKVAIVEPDRLVQPTAVPQFDITTIASPKPYSISIPMDDFQEIPTESLAVVGDKYLYSFNFGETKQNPLKNFTISTPQSWKLYLTKPMDDSLTIGDGIDGKDLLLAKNGDQLLIKQRWYETGSCVFKEEDVIGMGHLCTKVAPATDETRNWFIVGGDYSHTEQLTKTVSVCDNDMFADEEENEGREVCSLLTSIGVVTLHDNEPYGDTRGEFEEIVKGIELH